jgi:hypothetical protein
MANLEPTNAEMKLIIAAARGLTVDFSSSDPNSASPAEGSEWGGERTIRAEIIHALVTGSRTDWEVHAWGISIAGAKVVGRLNLGGARVKCRLAMVRCYFVEPIN